jgi:hypothetical protein
MLDILDKKTGKVVAVLMDDGTIVKREKCTDDIEELIKEQLSKKKKKGKTKNNG